MVIYIQHIEGKTLFSTGHKHLIISFFLCLAYNGEGENWTKMNSQQQFKNGEGKIAAHDD